MDSQLLVLKLILEELGQETKIESVDDRKRIQKAIYISQLSGLDLGYRYGWYLMGPYSRTLAKDYYELASALVSEDIPTRNLNSSVKDKLAKVKQLFDKPAEFDLTQTDWLELIASWHYLRKVNKKNEDEALAQFIPRKKHLTNYVKMAEEALTPIM
jgi:uncharacterized protein YwgA